MSNQFGILHIVSTPIGNLQDLSRRATTTFESVDLVAAEDTRRTGDLLTALGVRKPLISLHEHNEDQRVPDLLDRLRGGVQIALVSDAGTPLISDPGYRLVAAAIEAGISVTPIPGPCAAIAGLSISGLPTDRFFFEGFLPHKSGAKVAKLKTLEKLSGSLVFYVSVHRLLEDLRTIGEVLGSSRRACLARELTKRFESVYYGSLGELLARAADVPQMHKGELVLIVAGAQEDTENQLVTVSLEALLAQLVTRLSVKDAVEVAVAVSGKRRNLVYRLAQGLKRG